MRTFVCRVCSATSGLVGAGVEQWRRGHESGALDEYDAGDTRVAALGFGSGHSNDLALALAACITARDLVLAAVTLGRRE